MRENHKDVIAILAEKQMEMLEQLSQFCLVNTGSDNLPGLAHLHQILSHVFKPLADEIENYSFPPVSTIDLNGNTTLLAVGNALIIRKRPECSRRVLLAGHMDTVYPMHSAFQQLNILDENIISGPGVADMKGGLIVMLQALTVFEQSCIANQLGWDVVINADEEIGSPASSHLWDTLAPRYQTALIFEPAMDAEGVLAKNRKGSGKLTLIASGKAAHAGRSFQEGRNAICYLAEAIIAIHALNGQRPGVTINVGLVHGGEALNVVPDKAIAKLDIRIMHPDDEYWVRDSLGSIIQRLKRQDYSLTLHGGFHRPVKSVSEATQRLFARTQSIGEKLNLKLHWKDSGGCCDGNNLAHLGVPVLDTMGVRGGNIHSHEEYLYVDSLIERAALNALLLEDLAQGGLEELRS